MAASRTPKAASQQPASGRAAAAGASSALLGIHLRYELASGEQTGASLENPLFELVAALVEGESIRGAARLLNASYRHVWDAVRRWERLLGEPLVMWSQGRRAHATQFAHRLLLAERRARTRMQPHIEALRSDLERVLADARDDSQPLATISASHDLALSILQRRAGETPGVQVALTFCGSLEALHAMNDGRCLMAGFHLPDSTSLAAVCAKAMKPLLSASRHRLISCSRRQQGLMVRKEHAGQVRSLADVATARLRFVNRQPGSGTRMLADALLQDRTIAAARRASFTHHFEQTHVAVGLCVASGVADVGIGIEAAARQFGLTFIPLVEERYFLACLAENVDHPAVAGMRDLLAGEQWRRIIGSLSGYRCETSPGKLLKVDAELPWANHRRRAGKD